MKALSRARGVIRRMRVKYWGPQFSAAEALRGLEALYATPDPWNMESRKEQARFLRTNEILARELVAPAPQVSSILEIGSGEGHQSEHLRKLCARLTGIEIVACALERARIRLPQVEWVLGDLRDQPWPHEGRKFSIVTACEVLYACPDIPRTLQLMSQLGDACLVTYFGGAAHAVERYLRALPLAGRESFGYDGVTWHAVWWRSN